MLLDVICFSLPNKNIEINLLGIYELKKEKLGLRIHNKDIDLKDLLLTSILLRKILIYHIFFWCKNCSFPQNLHAQGIMEITLFHAVFTFVFTSYQIHV